MRKPAQIVKRPFPSDEEIENENKMYEKSRIKINPHHELVMKCLEVKDDRKAIFIPSSYEDIDKNCYAEVENIINRFPELNVHKDNLCLIVEIIIKQYLPYYIIRPGEYKAIRRKHAQDELNLMEMINDIHGYSDDINSISISYKQKKGGKTISKNIKVTSAVLIDSIVEHLQKKFKMNSGTKKHLKPDPIIRDNTIETTRIRRKFANQILKYLNDNTELSIKRHKFITVGKILTITGVLLDSEGNPYKDENKLYKAVQSLIEKYEK